MTVCAGDHRHVFPIISNNPLGLPQRGSESAEMFRMYAHSRWRS